MLRRLQGRWQRRWRWLLRSGCMPIVLLLAAGLIGFLNLITFRRVPGWVIDWRQYLIGGRLILSLVTLAIIEMSVSWMLGLLAAGSAARAAAGQGGLLHHRLEVVRRRLRSVLWTTVVLRIILLAGLMALAVFAYTPVLGFSLESDLLRELQMAFRLQPIPVAPAVFVMGIHWLIGPFLRLRYSLALGVWAASQMTRAKERVAAALNARLGAGLAGALALLWGTSVAGLVYEHLFTALVHRPGFYSWQVQTLSLSVVTLVVIYGAGQVFLPLLYMQMTRQRLRRRYQEIVAERVGAASKPRAINA